MRKVKLIHGKVSRLHCEFFEQSGVLYVRDLGSTNGTFVGDQKVEEPSHPTGPNGDHWRYKFEAKYDLADGAIATFTAEISGSQTPSEKSGRSHPPPRVTPTTGAPRIRRRSSADRHESTYRDARLRTSFK